jgi:hypothetical protein
MARVGVWKQAISEANALTIETKLVVQNGLFEGENEFEKRVGYCLRIIEENEFMQQCCTVHTNAVATAFRRVAVSSAWEGYVGVHLDRVLYVPRGYFR